MVLSASSLPPFWTLRSLSQLRYQAWRAFQVVSQGSQAPFDLSFRLRVSSQSEGPIPKEARDLILGRLLLVNFGEEVFILLDISIKGLYIG